MAARELCLAASLLLLVSSAAAQHTLPAIPDGETQEWASIPVLVDDPATDTLAADNFLSLHMADDGRAIFLRLQVARETLLTREADVPPGNAMELLIDGDGNAQTGLAVEDIGAEYLFQLGQRRAFYYDLSGLPVPFTYNELGVVIGPSVSSTDFEIQIPQRRPFFSTNYLPGPTIRIVLRGAPGGDRLPDTGAATYQLSGIVQPEPQPIPLAREHPLDVRVVSHNVLFGSIEEEPIPFARILSALNPDVLCFQELRSSATPQETAATLRSMVHWETIHVVKNTDTAVASRWPILRSAPVAGNIVALVDLPSDVSARNLVVFSAHTPCCENEIGRDFEHDLLSSTWRGLMGGAGPFPIAGDEPMVMTGDFNFVGYRRQVTTVQDGDLINNALFGPDFSPARAAGSLGRAALRHTHRRQVYTWRSGGSFPPGRLDAIFFTPDAMTLKRNYTLDASTLSPTVLMQSGLLTTDTSVSDHLPLVADFALPRESPRSVWMLF